jgi:hypothetical protein
MSEVNEAEITLASTTESQEELEHSAGPNWRQSYARPTIVEVEDSAEAGTAKTGAPEANAQQSTEKKPAEGKTATEKQPTAEKDELPPEVQKLIQKRIDKLTAKNKALEDELERSRGTQQSAKTETKTEAVAGNDPEPQPEDLDAKGQPKYARYEDFTKAQALWAAREAMRERETATSKQTAEAQMKQNWDAHNTRVAEAQGKYDDWDEAAAAIGSAAVPQAVGLAIVEMDNSADVLYHLAKHPEELEALQKMSSIRQVAEIGRLSAALLPSKTESPKTKPTSKAPAPITPVGSSSSTTPKNLDDPNISVDEFVRRRNLAERNRRR